MRRRRALERERAWVVSALTARTAANLAVERAKFSVVLMGASRRDVKNDGMRSAAHTPASKMNRTISMMCLRLSTRVSQASRAAKHPSESVSLPDAPFR